jgi:hypothetical protein
MALWQLDKYVLFVLYADGCEETVLECFKQWMDMDVARCPVLGAQEGITRAKDLEPGIIHILLESQLLFMPAGELGSAKWL